MTYLVPKNEKAFTYLSKIVLSSSHVYQLACYNVQVCGLIQSRLANAYDGVRHNNRQLSVGNLDFLLKRKFHF